MKILITNDDGIYADGLLRLVEWSRRLGDVTVVAPKYEQSGRSHGIVLNKSYEIRKSDVFDYLSVRSYSVDASPADCVRFTVDKIGDDFDILFSGINNGFNLGHDIAYSGTCGAAFEANYCDIKAVAFSTDKGDIEKASGRLDEVWKHISDNGYLSVSTFLNVNIPAEMQGIKVTEQGGAFIRDHFVMTGDDMYKAQAYMKKDMSIGFDLRYDTDAVLSGYCSVTPLSVNRTDREAFSKMSV